MGARRDRKRSRCMVDQVVGACPMNRRAQMTLPEEGVVVDASPPARFSASARLVAAPLVGVEVGGFDRRRSRPGQLVEPVHRDLSRRLPVLVADRRLAAPTVAGGAGRSPGCWSGCCLLPGRAGTLPNCCGVVGSGGSPGERASGVLELALLTMVTTGFASTLIMAAVGGLVALRCGRPIRRAPVRE